MVNAKLHKYAIPLMAIGFGVHFLANLASPAIYRVSPGSATMLGIVGFVAWLAMISGCCCYAASKGYAVFLGLIGIVPLLGIIVLCLLPSRYSSRKEPIIFASQLDEIALDGEPPWRPSTGAEAPQQAARGPFGGSRSPSSGSLHQTLGGTRLR